MHRLSPRARLFRTFKDLAVHLERYHGIDASTGSDRLHAIKRAAGRHGADVLLDRTGGVWDPVSRELLGLITDKTWG